MKGTRPFVRRFYIAENGSIAQLRYESMKVEFELGNHSTHCPVRSIGGWLRETLRFIGHPTQQLQQFFFRVLCRPESKNNSGNKE